MERERKEDEIPTESRTIRKAGMQAEYVYRSKHHDRNESESMLDKGGERDIFCLAIRIYGEPEAQKKTGEDQKVQLSGGCQGKEK